MDELENLLSLGKIERLPEICRKLEDLINFDTSSQISGGQESFYVIFLFLNRVFGEEATGCTRVKISENWVRGSLGGWLKQVSSERTRSSSSSSHALSSIPKELQGLGLNENTMQLLSLLWFSESGILKAMSPLHRCNDTTLSIFPRKIQMRLQGRPEYECVRSANHFIYDDWFVGRGMYQVANVPATDGSTTTAVPPSELDELTLSLDMFSFYLVCFLRYPLSGDILRSPYSHRQPSSVDAVALGRFFSSASDVHGVYRMLSSAPSARGNAYLSLLQRYLHLYLPSRVHTAERGSHYEDSGPINTQLSRKGELFLRLLIDFWVDSISIARFSFDKLPMFKDMMRRQALTAPATNALDNLAPGGGSVGSSGYGSRLLMTQHEVDQAYWGAAGNPSAHYTAPVKCTDVAFLESSTPTTSTLQCVYIVVSHVLSHIPEESLRYLGHGAASLRTDDMGASAASALPLPHAVQLLQQPVFDLLRSLLHRGDGLDRDKFLLVGKIWHLWLTPWKLCAAKKTRESNITTRTLTRAVSRVTESADEMLKWRTYIAANLHFYTTLLAIFLKSLAMWDIGSNFHCLYLLDVTLQIYTPWVVNSIDTLSMGFLHWLKRSATDASRAEMFLYRDFIQHVDEGVYQAYMEGVRGESTRTKNEFVPLSNVEIDAVRIQHLNLYPGMVNSDPTAAIVHFRYETREAGRVLIDALVRLSDVPKAFHEKLLSVILDKAVYPLLKIQASQDTKPSRQRDMSIQLRELLCIVESGLADRHDRSAGEDIRWNSRLGNSGRDSREDWKDIDKRKITFRGDVMTRPLRSDEFDILARLLVYWSKQINSKYNLPSDPSSVTKSWVQILRETKFGLRTYTHMVSSAFRVNLRFMAHIRCLSIGLFLLTVVIHKLHWIDDVYFYVIIATLLFAFSRGTFTGLLPWRSY
mmetsp:Transcript_14584/g.21982  ORF Transcript_14584/g.21982 Transcript_14584/m.21982 type:complete len:924 (-) Transcript_14584:68-2839(-)